MVNLSREMKPLIELNKNLELKSAISKRKNSRDGFNMTKTTVSKFEDKQ